MALYFSVFFFLFFLHGHEGPYGGGGGGEGWGVIFQYIDAWFYGEPPQNLGQKTAISQPTNASGTMGQLITKWSLALKADRVLFPVDQNLFFIFYS
jgi:hypothetical protein